MQIEHVYKAYIVTVILIQIMSLEYVEVLWPASSQILHRCRTANCLCITGPISTFHSSVVPVYPPPVSLPSLVVLAVHA